MGRDEPAGPAELDGDRRWRRRDLVVGARRLPPPLARRRAHRPDQESDHSDAADRRSAHHRRPTRPSNLFHGTWPRERPVVRVRPVPSKLTRYRRALLLTPEPANHNIRFSPSGRYVVDTFSTFDKPPVTVLRTADGRVIRKLEQADLTRLVEIGWKPGTVFTVKARDAVTDIYGVMWVPTNLDPSRKYPVIEYIYPGPQVGSVGQWAWGAGGENRALAELGFIVVALDHLGTPLRSKAFHDNYYGNFIDNGLPDHIAGLKQLGARFSFMDLDRVGIFGHSGGGFASTDAILRYPDFYKVAVSTAGNHDNRSYNIYWAEKYQGLLQRDTLRRSDNFAESANKMMAKNLKGHLLLMHGDMDDIVYPAMTIQVVDELIKANKSFDLIIAPNRNHVLNEPYFIRRRWDYFVQHLMSE